MGFRRIDNTYGISSYTFRRKYSFLNLEMVENSNKDWSIKTFTERSSNTIHTAVVKVFNESVFSCHIFEILSKKLNLCCGNVSRAETIWGNMILVAPPSNMTLQVAVYVTFHEYTFLISAEKVQSKSKGDIRKFHLAPTQCQISWQRIAYFRAYLATNLKALLRLFWKAEKMGISLRLLSNQLSIFKITWLCSIAEPSLEATPLPALLLFKGL